MKKWMGILTVLVLCMLCILPAFAEEPAQESAQETAEWTVMFYFCGSDLESGHSYASGNLEEIAAVMSYKTRGGLMPAGEDGRVPTEDVNVVIETGGSKEWHAKELGMDIQTDKLQRWVYHPDGNLIENKKGSYELVGEVPLASMADPATLTDFIKWSTENYPAKKYALVLWDHGTGAINGLIIDELYNGQTMPIYDLKKALDDGGVHFEALIFDACLMANIETAYAIRENANWMVASEELVAGKGSAVGDWLQQLYCTPVWNGERLGRWLCEMSQIKYSEENSEQSEDTLTWSVIDLSKVERLAAAFDRYFEYFNKVYKNNQEYTRYFCHVMNEAFEFGLGDADMIDLARIPYHPYNIILLDEDVYLELMDALTKTVVYNIHGPSRARAGGLSFCYASKLTPEQLDAYAKVCPSSQYLALMDAINPGWDAPDWVYEKAEKMPEIVDMPEYQIKIKKGIGASGVPEITVTDGTANLWMGYVDVSRLSPKTGNIVYLGSSDASYKMSDDENTFTFGMEGFPNWPTLEGVHCAAELVNTDFMEKALYHIPIQIGNDIYQLRCGYEGADKPTVIYGLWEGYNTDSTVFSRNVVPLSKMAGQDFCLLYPIKGTDPIRYESSEMMTMYRSLELSSKPLDPGTYYVEYYMKDIFMRILPAGRVEIQWDGQKLTVPEGTWEGESVLVLTK